jgi:hypothetical protein
VESSEEGERAPPHIGITELRQIRALVRTLLSLAVRAVRGRDRFHRRVEEVLGSRPGLSARLTCLRQIRTFAAVVGGHA